MWTFHAGEDGRMGREEIEVIIKEELVKSERRCSLLRDNRTLCARDQP